MSHPRPFYYLENFRTALTWLQQRYADLLDETEWAFIERFRQLPLASSALLVRMIGRKGDLFRTAKLRYGEIGCAAGAASALIEMGWVDPEPRVTVTELGRLLRKSELQRALQLSPPALGTSKAEILRQAEISRPQSLTLREWWPDAPDVVYRVVVIDLCDRLRGLFFGNFRQEWSQFVLTDLGIFKYEKIDVAARAFQTRGHIETFYALHACRKRLEEDQDVSDLLCSFPQPVDDNEWLEARRRKTQFRIAQRYERQRDLARALEIYRSCPYSGARLRCIRLLERLGEISAALELATQVQRHAADEVEAQQLARMWPRLQRKAGLIPEGVRRSRDWVTFEVELPVNERPVHLERATGDALSRTDAPVYYVENGLLNSLFGLLCWDAIFAPVRGAFFHEFQAAPADLYAPEFRARREALFSGLLQQLDSDDYRTTIEANFARKHGVQSPFVYWGLLSDELLRLALTCLPPGHLKACFERMIADVRSNTAGLPDLIQFFPAERGYRLIEVKGPGDRLQDNQIRWLTFFGSRDIPVAVCHVRWGTEV